MSGMRQGISEVCPWCRQHSRQVTVESARDLVPGVDSTVPLYDGSMSRYVNLDNAATTPPFRTVLDCLNGFADWYSSVHRGTGFKSLLTTQAYEYCRRVVADFIGADLSYHTVIFVQNATHALNKLAARMCLPQPGAFVTTLMEHHSNLLPWRKYGYAVEHANVRRADGGLDMNDLRSRIGRNAGRLRLISVTGASNVTGNMPPIRSIARLAHQHGALMALDATQVIPHRPFKMGPPGNPESIDFVAFSGHKMHAPFGCGVLVGPRRVFEQGPPDVVGGGTVHAVTETDALWAEPPEREEAGTPNVLGAMALAAAIGTLNSIGMDNVAEHEKALTRRALRELLKLDGLTLYGLRDEELRQDRIGVIAMNARRLDHGHLAAALGYEWGVGVRNGCFCAQPYVRELLGTSESEVQAATRRLAAGDHVTVPGMVRMSLGLYNSEEDVDLFVEALQSILTDGPRARYVLRDPAEGYVPESLPYDFAAYRPF